MQRTTVNLNLQSISAKQELASVFQANGILLTSPQLSTLSVQLAPNEIRDLSESLSKITTTPASTNDPDVLIQFIALKSETGFDLSLFKAGQEDLYEGALTTMSVKTFLPSANRFHHFKVRAGSVATTVFIVIGHGSLTP
ncbi:hypothetical protein ACQ4M3_09420 [Leptolyngbya sp. AN03gr2]|uniref:hypothetical protein n=1 Tax=Leptolyngbya sp. AN03gr2 TaxID=3423364 RepID=UPI003D31D102